MLPNWIIIGAPKSSTTSLFRWLVAHPEVCGFEGKETRYFVDRASHLFRADSNFAVQGLAGYERLFETCRHDAKVVLEASPTYLYERTALRELPRLSSRPRLIAVLREPVAQLQSIHRYFQHNWNVIPRDMGFADFIQSIEQRHDRFNGNVLVKNALEQAWYSTYLRKWQAAVGAERLVPILFEDVVRDPRSVMQRLAREMDIDPGYYDDFAFDPDNSTYVAKSAILQKMNISVREWLPKGTLYRGLRHAYRRWGTHRAAPAADGPIERELSRRFLPMLDELHDEFGLDMTAWRTAMNARLDRQPPAGAASDPRAAPRPASGPATQVLAE